MKTLRNLSFVILVVVAFGTNAIDLRAAPDPIDCPEAYADGCECWGECWVPNAEYTVQCQEVYDCDETYPNFCADFMDACYEFCWESSETLPWDTSCGSDFGECNGTCACGTALWCDVGEYHPAG